MDFPESECRGRARGRDPSDAVPSIPMQGRSLEEAARRLADGHRALVADRVLEPLASDTHDTQRWMDCDLASFVEDRLFETMDPTMLTDDLRRAWTARATRPDERIESPHERAWYLSPFWLLAAGERVGTIALANSLAGADVVSVRSLYVTPRHRRRGIAGRALRRCDAVLRAHGARGLRIPTWWSWQGCRAVLSRARPGRDRLILGDTSRGPATLKVAHGLSL